MKKITFLLAFFAITTLAAQTIIEGNVTYDTNCNSNIDGSDFGHPVLKVELYVDVNNDGIPDPTELVATDITDSIGNYQFNYSNSSGVYTERIVQPSDDALEIGNSMDLFHYELNLLPQSSTQRIGLRYQNLPIPNGSTITNAHVQFQARGTETSVRPVTISGEDIDDAPTFIDVDNNISSRTYTSSNVIWNIPEWTNDDQGADQLTPDIKSIIQEIVNRTGWAPFNDLAVIFSHTTSTSRDRTADSFENNAKVAPQLSVSWTNTAISGNLIVKIADNNFTGLTVTQTPSQYQGLSQGVTHINQNFLVCGESPLCYAIADNDNSGSDGVVVFNRINGVNDELHPSPTTDVESLVFNGDGSFLVGIGENGQMVSIDPKTGLSTPFPKTLFEDINNTQLDFINGSPDEADTNTGSMDIDGLAVRADGNFWGTIRRSGSDEWDVLVVIDGTTGAIIPNTFGTGLHGLALYYSTGTILRDADDLALDPATGTLYVCVNAGSTTQQRVMDVNITTGLIGANTNLLMTYEGSPLDDVEGFGFTNNGLLYITTGSDGDIASTNNSAYLLNLTTGAATNQVNMASEGVDYEGCDCLSRGVLNPLVAALPINLLSFAGQYHKNNNSVELNWTTENEINNDRFDIMASTDGKNYVSIATQRGKGNSNQRQDYQYVDNKDISEKSKTHYYRLKQIDFDGEFSYSNIVAIHIDKDDDIHIYPNPIKQGQLINIKSENTTGFTLYNSIGQRVLRQETYNNNAISLETKSLKDNIYFIVFDNGQHHKLIIN